MVKHSDCEILELEILAQANKLVTESPYNLPIVRPAENGPVAFTWSHKYPKKELEIWLYAQPNLCSEWMLSVEELDEENTAQSLSELLEVVKRYQEL